MAENAERARGDEWIARRVALLSPGEYKVYEVLRVRESRFQRNVPTDEERIHFEEVEARRRLDELLEGEARNVERAWQLWKFRHELSRSAIAEDEEELDVFTYLSHDDQIAAASVLSEGEASTVDEAVAIFRGREQAGEGPGDE